MFTTGADGFATPIPKHLLETPYRDAKETFRQLPYWSAEYVGNGPYRVREFVADEHVVLEANDRFVLGRPKIDQIDVRFIPDPNTMTANILSNAVDFTLGSNLSLEQSVDVRDQWRDGRMELTYASWIVIYPQFINPSPAIVSDVRFRRALLLGIDRQAMAEVIQKGLVPVAHSYLTPTDPEYKETESAIVRYEYDTRQAERTLNELGYSRGGDSTMRDAQGQVLHLEVRTTASPAIHGKTFFPMVDYWERMGLDIDPVVIPVQRLTDLEYRTQQPTFEVVRYPNGAVNLWRVHSDQTPLPQSKFTGHNRSRYMNPELDGMIDRYNGTIAWEPRMEVLRGIIGHMTTVLNVMGLFYDTKTIMVSNRLNPNVYAQNTSSNAHEWTVK
jgi:peptide/nickel transport system substrate-binding protein